MAQDLQLVHEHVEAVAAALHASEREVAGARAALHACHTSAATTGRLYGAQGGALSAGADALGTVVADWSQRCAGAADALSGAVATLTGADRGVALDLGEQD